MHGSGFDAEVVRTSRRKTVTIKVQEGKVSVIVPKTTGVSKIEALVAKKSRWIREKLLLQKQHPPRRPKEYVSGESFSYLGRNYRLKIEIGITKEASLKNSRLIVQVPGTVQKREQYIQ